MSQELTDIDLTTPNLTVEKIGPINREGGLLITPLRGSRVLHLTGLQTDDLLAQWQQRYAETPRKVSRFLMYASLALGLSTLIATAFGLTFAPIMLSMFTAVAATLSLVLGHESNRRTAELERDILVAAGASVVTVTEPSLEDLTGSRAQLTTIIGQAAIDSAERLDELTSSSSDPDAQQLYEALRIDIGKSVMLTLGTTHTMHLAQHLSGARERIAPSFTHHEMTTLIITELGGEIGSTDD